MRNEREGSEPTKYDHGVVFYEREMAAANERLASAETSYDALVALEDLETARLKLTQTRRRQDVLERGQPLIAGRGDLPVEDQAVTRHFKEVGC